MDTHPFDYQQTVLQQVDNKLVEYLAIAYTQQVGHVNHPKRAG
jgi:hypothetical protein